MSPRGLRHPGRWIWLLLAIPALLGFWRLRLDLEVLNLLPDTLAPVRGLKAYQEHFTSARELLVVFKGHDPAALSEQVTSVATKLRSESNLVQRVTYQPPWQEHPGEFAEFLAYLWLNQEPSLFNNLSERIKAPEKILSDVKEELTTSLSPDRIARGSYDPFGFSEVSDLFGSQASQQQGEQVFQNAEGTFRLMFVEAPRDLKSFQECEAWIKSIRRIVHKMDPPVAGAAPTQVYFTGRPAFVAEIGRGMERDMRWSVIGTAIIIAALFWVAHRRFKPLLWLLFLLAVILVGAVGLGAFIFGTIYVISAGFAAILLGLAVDYALLHYQEAVTHPNLTVPQVRRVIAPGVTWAAITTIIAFLMLNLGGLPGLAQLGTMVALGVALAAVVIVFVTERTREIGIRMAIGARGSDVMTQFLVESVVMSLLGGVLGLIVGVGGSMLLGRLTGWATSVPGYALVIAVGFSAAVGVFFGFYPARKAAALNPIQALRYE